MSAPGYVLGQCSACGGRAEKSPVSARWWHLGPFCRQTSRLWFLPVSWDEDGVFGPTDATELPVHFVEDTSW